MSNADDLRAMNDYVMNRSAPAAGAPAAVMSKWQLYKSQWQSWYPGVIGSWYVSDADLAHGKAIRNALMQNQNPDAWQYVQETAADKPDRKAYADRPDAPKPSKAPWQKQGLTYSGKYKTKASVMELQKRINAAGYKPPLKVDGKYGPGTQKGEQWLNAHTEAANEAAKQIAETPVATGGQRAPAAQPKPASPVAVPPPTVAKAKTNILGIPVSAASVIGSLAGAGAGWALGGPVGAIIGAPVGFFGGSKIPSK